MVWFCPSKVPPYQTPFELALYPMGVHCLKVSFFSVFSVPSGFSTPSLTVMSAVSTALAWGFQLSSFCRSLTISANPYSSFALLIWYTPFSSLSGSIGVMSSVSANTTVGSSVRHRSSTSSHLNATLFMSVPPKINNLMFCPFPRAESTSYVGQNPYSVFVCRKSTAETGLFQHAVN